MKNSYNSQDVHFKMKSKLYFWIQTSKFAYRIRERFFKGWPTDTPNNLNLCFFQTMLRLLSEATLKNWLLESISLISPEVPKSSNKTFYKVCTKATQTHSQQQPKHSFYQTMFKISSKNTKSYFSGSQLAVLFNLLKTPKTFETIDNRHRDIFRQYTRRTYWSKICQIIWKETEAAAQFWKTRYSKPAAFLAVSNYLISKACNDTQYIKTW